MGWMNLSQFRTELNHSIGPRVQSNNDLLDLWINRAYFDVANMGCFHFLKICVETMTVSGQVGYALPPNLMEILSIADLTTKNRLVRTSVSRFHQFDRTVKGDVKFYVRRAGTLYLWPAPAKVVEIEMLFVAQPEPLLEPTDQTVLPNAFDHTVSLFSQRNAFLNIGLEEEATLRHQSGVAHFRDMMSELDHQTSSLKEGVGVAHSFDDLTRMIRSTP